MSVPIANSTENGPLILWFIFLHGPGHLTSDMLGMCLFMCFCESFLTEGNHFFTPGTPLILTTACIHCKQTDAWMDGGVGG